MALLAGGQLLVWAGLFYTFAALLLHWESDLGWAKPDLMLGFTLAILSSAIVAPLSGRLIDAGFGKWVLSGGALLGAALLASLSQVTGHAGFLILWMMIGATHALCLYEPCFAFVTRTVGVDARWAITRITLVAGFASTAAFPFAALLAGAYGWRMALLVFALIIVLVAVPLLFAGAVLLERSNTTPPILHARNTNKAAVRSALRRVEFWLIAMAFALISLNHGMVLSHVLPLFVDRGATTSQAVLAAMMIGPAQVAGRVVMMRLEARVSTIGVALSAISGGCIAALVLFLSGFAPMLIFLFALLQGAAFGVVSILRQVLVAETLGRVAFGAISSRIAVPFLLAAASAPYLGALLWRLGGYDLVIVLAFGFASLSLSALIALKRRGAGQNLPRPE